MFKDGTATYAIPKLAIFLLVQCYHYITGCFIRMTVILEYISLAIILMVYCVITTNHCAFSNSIIVMHHVISVSICLVSLLFIILTHFLNSYSQKNLVYSLRNNTPINYSIQHRCLTDIFYITKLVRSYSDGPHIVYILVVVH